MSTSDPGLAVILLDVRSEIKFLETQLSQLPLPSDDYVGFFIPELLGTCVYPDNASEAQTLLAIDAAESFNACLTSEQMTALMDTVLFVGERLQQRVGALKCYDDQGYFPCQLLELREFSGTAVFQYYPQLPLGKG